MKNTILTTFFFFSIIFYAKGQLNYHVGFQYNLADIKGGQWNWGYDFMKEGQLHSGLYIGFHLLVNKNNKHEGEFSYYRFPIGFRYYFKTKSKEVDQAFFINISHNISPLVYVSPASLINSYKKPDIINLGFGLTGGVKLLLPKRWEIILAGNFNFDYDSIFKENRNRKNILLRDGGIFISLGFNFNVTSNRNLNE